MKQEDLVQQLRVIARQVKDTPDAERLCVLRNGLRNVKFPQGGLRLPVRSSPATGHAYPQLYPAIAHAYPASAPCLHTRPGMRLPGAGGEPRVGRHRIVSSQPPLHTGTRQVNVANLQNTFA